MSITTAIAIYFVMWWITLLVFLPLRIRSQHEGEGYHLGTDPGAPVAPSLGKRLLWNTAASAVLFGASMFAWSRGWLNVERLTSWMGMPF